MGWGDHHLDAYDPDIGRTRTFTPDELQKARGRSLVPGYRFYDEDVANKMIECKHPNAYYYGDTNPPTYKCPDCGATFIKAEKMAHVDRLHIDDYMCNILNEYDGFKYKSSLSEDQIRVKLAEYAVACLHDTKLAQEAMDVIQRQGNRDASSSK